MPRSRTINSLILALLVAILDKTGSAQDWLRISANLSRPIRIADPDFRPVTTDTQTTSLNSIFNQTLWNDLDNAGIFELVSKSFYPMQAPGSPDQLRPESWHAAPVGASAVAFGSLGVSNGKLAVQAWLFDLANTASPQLMSKQYKDAATADNARLIAHRVADEIIDKLSGIEGIAESQVVFISSRSGHKEVWAMDYDGTGQEQLTHLNSIALSPRLSPGRSRVAFSGLTGDSWQILIYSMDLGRLVSFPHFGGNNFTPAWSSDGSQVAFSSSMHSSGPEIFAMNSVGGVLHRLTSFKGSDVAPAWNPKTNREIAWVSGRNGLPQIFIMAADGSNVQQITSEGYAVSPAWSPNGRLLAFSWIRHYGPNAPGGQDIYVMDLASREFVQLTHDARRNDFPSWSADGRHLVFQSTRTGSEQIWTMLADGTHQQQLTRAGNNSQPNWSNFAATAALPQKSAGPPAVLPLPANGRPVSASDQELFDQNVRDIYFDYDSAQLPSEELRFLNHAAQIINQHPDWLVAIEGSADERGSAEYNLTLAEERAQAAKLALVKAGVEATRIKVISYGKEKPACTESNADCWQKNRHAHFLLR